MFKFVKVKANYLSKNNDTYWALFVENLMDLHLYLMAKNPQLVGSYHKIKSRNLKSQMGFEKSLEEQKVPTNVVAVPTGHCMSPEELAVETLFSIDRGHKGVVEDILCLHDTFSKPKLDCIKRGEKLLINPSGIGFCPYNEDYHTILETRQSNTMNFPDDILTESDIRVNRWEGGTHWYVRVGQHDLPDKYSTYESGYKAGKQYLKTK